MTELLVLLEGRGCGIEAFGNDRCHRVGVRHPQVVRRDIAAVVDSHILAEQPIAWRIGLYRKDASICTDPLGKEHGVLSNVRSHLRDPRAVKRECGLKLFFFTRFVLSSIVEKISVESASAQRSPPDADGKTIGK